MADMPIETTKFDAADYMETTEDVIAQLEAALEDGDPALIKAVLGDIARSKGMSMTAEVSGLSRMGLHKALGADGDPKLSTLLSIMSALGLQLSVVRKTAA